MSDVIYYLSWVLIGLIYVTTAIVIWQICKFVSVVNFNQDFWRCRQPILTIIYITSFLLVLCVLNPLTIFLYNIIGLETMVVIFVNDIADMLIFLLLFPRAWILWFDRTFFDNLKNWLWRRELNPQDGNFLVRYRATLKSSHLIVYSVYLLIVAPIFTTLNILPYFDVIPFWCDVMRTCLLMILFCSTWKIVRQISIVFDEHHIRTELLLTVNSSGVAYILAHVAYVLLEYFFNDKRLALLIELFFICISHMFVLYYALYWTRVTFETAQKIRLMTHLKRRNGRRSSFLGLLTKRIQFQDIMDHRNGIEAFCNHLQNEFGLESILFLLEVTQFKAMIRNVSNGLIEDNVPKLCDWHSTDYAGQTYMSDMFQTRTRVFSAASILNISWLPIDPRMFHLKPYQIALHVYDKYVDETADLTINISFSIRKEIYRYFQKVLQTQHNTSLHNIDIQIDSNDKKANNLNETNPLVQMYKIYDSAFTEVWRLIQTDSFLRFKSTDDFRRLATVLFPEEAEKANATLARMMDEEMARDKREKKEKRNGENNDETATAAFSEQTLVNDFTLALESINEEAETTMNNMLKIKKSNSLSKLRSKSPLSISPRSVVGSAREILSRTKFRRSKSSNIIPKVPMLPLEQTSVPLMANLSNANNIKKNKKIKERRRHTAMNNPLTLKRKTNIESQSMQPPLSLINSRSHPTTPGETKNMLLYNNMKMNGNSQILEETKFNRVYSNSQMSQTLEENELNYTFTTIHNTSIPPSNE